MRIFKIEGSVMVIRSFNQFLQHGQIFQLDKVLEKFRRKKSKNLRLNIKIES